MRSAPVTVPNLCRAPTHVGAGQYLRRMQSATAVVADLVRQIDPVDELERQHITDTLAWLGDTDDIFRRVAPAIPRRHLVSYVVLVDPDEYSVFLGRHRKADLWLPMGGHVEPAEHPLATARREAAEELGITAEFTATGDRPVFLTSTTVTRPLSHEDTSLWYTIRGSRHHAYRLDPAEFDGGAWWDLDPHAIPDSDPHIARFFGKLRTVWSDPLQP